MKVIADLHERQSGVIAHLEAKGAEVAVEALPVGDYLLSGRLAVERKTVSDLIELSAKIKD